MSRKGEVAYTFKAEMPLRQVLEEVRQMNAGRPKKAYLRFRVHFFTFQYRKLLADKEKVITREAMTAAQTVGARVVAARLTPYSMEIDYLCPAEVGCEKANRTMARATSEFFKRNFRGIGSADNNGFLWHKHYITYTMESPLLERPHEFETI